MHKNHVVERREGCLPHSRKCFAEGEGLLVVLGLDGVGAANFEGGTGDETGAASQGEGDGDAVQELAVAVVDADGFVLHNVKTDEQGGGLLGGVVGGYGGHFTHAATDRKHLTTLDDKG